jgi:hypothetical protein
VVPGAAKAYVLGWRRMPSHKLRKLVEFMQADVLETQSSIMALELHAKNQDREWRPRTGMWEMRDWYGDGVIRNKQWKWGAPRKTG